MKKFSIKLLTVFTGLIGSKKLIFSIGIMVISGFVMNSMALKPKPTMKLGAYYFAGWAGKCPYDDGTPRTCVGKRNANALHA